MRESAESTGETLKSYVAKDDKGAMSELAGVAATNDWMEGVNDLYSWLLSRFPGVRPSTVVASQLKSPKFAVLERTRNLPQEFFPSLVVSPTPLLFLSDP